MAEEKKRPSNGESTNDLSFEAYLKKQFELVFNRLDLLETDIHKMVEFQERQAT